MGTSHVMRASFSDWAQARRIAFGILLRAAEHNERDNESRELTWRHLLLHNNAVWNGFAEGDDVDAMIFSLYLAGFRYALIQAPGSLLLDKPRLRDEVEMEMEAGFFLLGHILDHGEEYFSIHHQCMLIDLECWNFLGRPAFGRSGREPQELHVPARSPENFHGLHTPVWIGPTTTKKLYESYHPGWNFVRTALDKNARVAPFSQAIRKCKTYLYPEKLTDYYFKVGDISRRARRWSESAWVLNTEELEMDRPPVAAPVERIVGVASGLKTYALLHQLGYSAKTEIDYIDSSHATLEFKRWLVQSWDGCDYPGAVSQWQTATAPLSRLQSGASSQQLKIAWKSTLTYFGGQHAFKEHWRKLRKLKHSFTHIDILCSQASQLVDMIAPGEGTTVLWLSNIFHSNYSQSILSSDATCAMYSSLLKRLRIRSPEAILLCRDPYNRPVSNSLHSLPDKLAAPSLNNCYFPRNLLEWFGQDIADVGRRDRDE